MESTIKGTQNNNVSPLANIQIAASTHSEKQSKPHSSEPLPKELSTSSTSPSKTKLILPPNSNISSPIVGDICNPLETIDTFRKQDYKFSTSEDDDQATIRYDQFSNQPGEDALQEAREENPEEDIFPGPQNFSLNWKLFHPQLRQKSLSIEEKLQLTYYKLKGKVIEKFGTQERKLEIKTKDEELESLQLIVSDISDIQSKLIKVMKDYSDRLEFHIKSRQELGKHFYEIGMKDHSLPGSLMCNLAELLKNTNPLYSQLLDWTKCIVEESTVFKNSAIKDTQITLTKAKGELENYDALRLKLQEMNKKNQSNQQQQQQQLSPKPIKDESKHDQMETKLKSEMDLTWKYYQQLQSVCNIKTEFLSEKRFQQSGNHLSKLLEKQTNLFKQTCIAFKIAEAKQNYIIEKSETSKTAIYT